MKPTNWQMVTCCRMLSTCTTRVSQIATMEYLFKLSCVKNTLLVVYLVFILILVMSIITSVILHGINPTLFLLTIFDLNSVIQLSETLQNAKDTDGSSAAYIAINRPSSEFLFVALILYLTAIFNQMIAIVAIIRRHLCVLVFTLMVNLLIFCLSVTFVKTNLFLLLILVVLLTISYTIMLKQVKSEVHEGNQYAVLNHNHSQQAPVAHQARHAPDHFGSSPATIDATAVHMYQPSTPNDPKILAPIIYCPHYTESVC